MKAQNLRPVSVMKLFAFLCLFPLLLNAQQIDSSSIELSPQGYFDDVFDQYGTKYRLSDLILPDASDQFFSSSTVETCDASGYFKVYFEDGWNGTATASLTLAYKENICKVFSDIAAFLPAPSGTPLAGGTAFVNIAVGDISKRNLPPSTLAVASGYLVYPLPFNAAGGVFANQVMKIIQSGYDPFKGLVSTLHSPITPTPDAGQFYHGAVAMNPLVDWNTNLNAVPTSVQYDLYSVMLHEILHALGINSLINFEGKPRFGPDYNYYSVFDTFLRDKSGTQKLILPASSACSQYDYQFNPALAASVLHPGCLATPPIDDQNISDSTDCLQAIRYIGKVDLPIYTPSCFEPNSSLSHFANGCTPVTASFVMCPKKDPGTIQRYPHEDERLVLCDIGYTVAATYGVPTIKDYITSVCTENRVFGQNDGFDASTNNYIYSTLAAGPTVTFTGIIDNDIHTTDYKCLEVIIGSATAVRINANQFQYTPPPTPGVVLLRYIPIDSQGKEGNITYVYVENLYTSGNQTVCDLIQNGDFESFKTCPKTLTQFTVSNWQRGNTAYNPDYFNSNPTANCGPGSDVTVPTNILGTQPDLNGGYAYTGIGVYHDNTDARFVDYKEYMSSKLLVPMDIGTTYRVTFHASLADGAGYAVNRLGALFTDQLPTASFISGPPQVEWQGGMLNDDSQWVPISGTFTATSSYAYITIGNFTPNSSTPVSVHIPSVSGSGIEKQSYYYIDEVSVVSLQAAQSITLSTSKPIICQGEQSTLTVMPTNFVRYDWSEPGLLSNPVTVSPSVTTTYTVTATDNNGCRATAEIVMDVLPSPTITISPSQAQVCPGTSATLTVNSSGSFTWTDGATDNPRIVNPGTTTVYSATVSNGSSCIGSASATVSSSSPVLTVTGPATSICANENALLTASGGLTYLWSTGQSGDNITVHPATTTTYSVTMTDASGCTASKAYVLQVNTPPQVLISASKNNPVCPDQSLTLTASGAVNYVWDNALNTAVRNVTPAATTSYSVTATDANNCSASAMYTVQVSAVPQASITAAKDPVCAGQQTTLTAFGGQSYTWNNLQTSASINVSPSSVTNYSVTVSDANACTASATYQLQVFTPATFSISATKNPVCAGQSIDLLVAGASGSYIWSDGSVSNPATVTPLANTQYSVTASDANACTNSAAISILVNPLPVVAASASPASLCGNATSDLSATGALTYTWSDGSTANPHTIGPLSATTTYTVTGTDSEGCTASAGMVLPYSPTCPCTNCTPSLVLSGAINSSPVGNQTYCINSDIEITGSNVAFLNCEIKIANDVKIIVRNGAKLVLAGSHLYSCGDMWEGILVEDGGRISVINSPQINTRIIIQLFPLIVQIVVSPERTALIEDAKTAINIKGSSVTSDLLQVNNAIFNRNYTSIHFEKYEPQIASPYNSISIQNAVFTSRIIDPTATPFDWPNISTFKNANFGTPLTQPYINNTTYPFANLKAPNTKQASQSGIQLSGVGTTIDPELASTQYREVQIGNATAANFNLFDNQLAGVRAFNANFACINNVFQNTPNQNNGRVVAGIYAQSTAGGSGANCRIRVVSGNSTGANNRFFNCHWAIQTDNYLEHVISNCDIRSNQTQAMYGFLHQGRSGIYIESNAYRNIAITGNTIYNIENPIMFIAEEGPLSVGSVTGFGQFAGPVTINNNTIANNDGGSSSDVYVKQAISLQNTASGPAIALAPLAANDVLSVSINTLQNVYRGIFTSGWQGSQGFDVTRNVIEMLPDPFAVGQEGISTINNGGTAIHRFYGNTLRGNAALINTAGTVAIYSSACDNLRVVRNTCSDASEGVKFNMLHTTTRFSCNTLSTHKFGFVLSNAIIGEQGNPSAPGAPLDANSPADNQWTGSWTPPNYKTTAPSSNASFSRMWVRSTNNFNPDGSADPIANPVQNERYSFGSGNLKPANNAAPNRCSVSAMRVAAGGNTAHSVDERSYRRTDINLLEQIALDQVPYAINVSEARFINKHQVYKLLLNGSSLCDSSAILKDFKHRYEDRCIGLLQHIEEALAAGDLVQASNLNNSLDLLHPTEINYQTYNRICIKHRTDTLDSNDSLALYAVAAGCPSVDGVVVYKARSLYNSITHGITLFADNCPQQPGNARYEPIPEKEGKQLVGSQKRELFDVIVYPNPSKDGYIQISAYGKIPADDLHIEAFDVTGKMVYCSDVSCQNSTCTIKMDVVKGIYFLQITDRTTRETVVKKLGIHGN